MAGSFIVITHQGSEDAMTLLQQLYARTGIWSEPLADVGIIALSPGSLGCPTKPGR